MVGNEKGGAGKSTIALHLTTALLHSGAKVGVIDLDLRQRSIGRFFANRRAWMEAAGLAALFALPAFGLAALSVRKRRKRDPEGPTPRDWALGVGAAVLGALVPAVLFVLLVTIFWA